MTTPHIFHERAPAKINLYLHVKRKREDGYHDLDSLLAFTDFGDEISLIQSNRRCLKITGSFASGLSDNEQTLEKTSQNILAKTLWAIANYAHEEPLFDITLTKNIPLGAGLGGGSTDAAALAHILCNIWNIDSNASKFQNILFTLGADVPACFYAKPCRIQNAGEAGFTKHNLPPLDALLIHPNEHCSTASIFKSNNQYLDNEIKIPDTFETSDDLITFLKNKENTLTKAAIKNIPTIQSILNTLQEQNCAILSRMSGSGSACFAIFNTQDAAHNVAQTIKNLHPEWWVQVVQIS